MTCNVVDMDAKLCQLLFWYRKFVAYYRLKGYIFIRIQTEEFIITYFLSNHHYPLFSCSKKYLAHLQ